MKIHTAYCFLTVLTLSITFNTRSVSAQEFTRLPLNTIPNEQNYVPGQVVVKVKDTAVLESLVLDKSENVKGLSTLTKPTKLKNENIQNNVLNIQSRYNIKSASTIYPVTPTLEINNVEPGTGQAQTTTNDLESVLLLQLDENVNTQQIVNELNQDPNVEYAEPNYIAYAAETIPQDPYFQYLWALKNTGQGIGSSIPGGTQGADTKATRAWDVIKGSPNVTVCVVDSAVKTRDSEISDILWVNTGETPYNGIDDDNNGFIDDINGYDFVADWGSIFGDYTTHGNFVAHQIGAQSNDVGDVGIAYGVKIANPIGLDSETGKGSFAAIASAIKYSVDVPRCKIINLSLGGESDSRVLKEAVDYAESKGVLLVTAAGNGGTDGIGDNNDTSPHYPSNYPNNNIIAVAATDNTNSITSFSNFGTTNVDIAAPGQDIVIGYDEFGQDKNALRSGTSMATPYVAGTAALILSKHPNYNTTQLKNAILNSADTNIKLAGKVAGTRQLNTLKAVNYTGSNPNPTPNTTPATTPSGTPTQPGLPPELIMYDLNFDDRVDVRDIIKLVSVVFK